jgi:trk system potassium uptake protein TrkA
MAKNMGLDTIINPKELTSGNVISYVRSLQNAYGSEIESLYHLVDNRIEAIEFRVTENIPGVVDVPLKDMKTKKNILICAIIRKREIIIPDGDAEIQLGDTVVVVAKEQTISSLNSIVSR